MSEEYAGRAAIRNDPVIRAMVYEAVLVPGMRQSEFAPRKEACYRLVELLLGVVRAERPVMETPEIGCDTAGAGKDLTAIHARWGPYGTGMVPEAIRSWWLAEQLRQAAATHAMTYGSGSDISVTAADGPSDGDGTLAAVDPALDKVNVMVPRSPAVEPPQGFVYLGMDLIARDVADRLGISMPADGPVAPADGAPPACTCSDLLNGHRAGCPYQRG